MNKISFLLASFAVLSLTPLGAQDRFCVAPDDGTGTIEWPAPCPWGNALSLLILETSPGERVSIGVSIPEFVDTCVPGNPPTYHSGLNSPDGPSVIPATIRVERRGKVVEMPADLLLSVTNRALSPPGSRTQTFDTEILAMSLSSRAPVGPGFPDVSISLSPGGESSGGTTLRQLPSGDFLVDSFFDIYTEISVVGQPGGEWEGVDVTGQATLSLSQSLDAFGGVPFDPIGDAVVYNDGVCLQVDNLGSSGQDGVRIGGKRDGSEARRWNLVRVSLGAPTTGAFLAEGDALSAFPFPPPPTDFPDLPDLPPSVVFTNSAGTVAGVCVAGATGTTEWITEVVQGKEWKRTVVVDDGSTAFTTPAINFKPIRLEVTGRSGGGGGGVVRVTLCNDGDTEFTLPGIAAPVVGDRISFSVRDPRVLPGFIEGLELLCTRPLCIERVEVGAFDALHSAVGNASLSGNPGRLEVGNLGSSGCDGVSTRTWYPDCDDDGAFELPYSCVLEPLDVEGARGSFFVSSLDGNGDNVATSEYRGGGGGGGRIFVDYKTSSTTCRVSVLNGGVPVGDFDVPISSDVPTEVCVVGSDASGNSPLLTGCGKLRIGWPWDLSCLVQEFDRPVPITPVGGLPLVGDEVRLLAPGATPQEVASIRRIELRASGLPEFIVCGGSTGPFLPSPVLPPTPDPTWAFPGAGLQLAQEAEIYYTWDPATGQAVCVNKTIRDMVPVSENGTRRTFSAVMDVELEGVGGLLLSKRLALPGVIEVAYPLTLPGDDVYQYPVELRNLRFALPPGADPDIAQLRVTAGSDNGFPGGGDVDVRKIPECELEIQAILDILAELDLQGAPGGPLAGGGPLREVTEEALHLIQPAGARSGGITFNPLATAGTTGSGGVLTISNIGSSGEDGVSLDLPQVEGVDIQFTAAAPVDLLDGGSFDSTYRGRAWGGRYLTWRTRCRRVAGPAGDSFFDVSLDAAPLMPTGTSVEIYDGGTRVATLPGGAERASVEVHPSPGLGLSPIKGCGKLPGRSQTPCNFFQFCDPVIFRANGLPDVVGDEVRLLVHGVEFESLSSLDLQMANTVGDVEVASTAVGLFGRQLTCTGGASISEANWNTTRSNKIKPIRFDPDPDGDGVGGEVEVRAPNSVFLPGRRQLWPLRCDLDPDSVVFNSPGGSLKFEACGTIGGVPGSSYGVLEACTDPDGNFVLKGDFSSRGVSEVCISVVKELDKASPKLAEAVVPSGDSYATIRLFRGGGSFPLGHVRAVPELYEPPFDEVECSYTLCFAHPVEVTLPGQPPVVGTDIEVLLVAPTNVSEDVECLRIGGQGFKPLVIGGVGTGPFYGQGLVQRTLGGAQVEEQSPGDRGHLVVSNIGSSGEDGVRVDLDQSDGVWQQILPLDLNAPGSELTLAISEPCLGTPEDCEELARARIRRNSTMALSMGARDSGGGSVHTVVATSGGAFGGSVAVSSSGETLVGTLASNGGGDGHLVGYGLLPPTLIEGHGHVPACLALEFDRPMVFAPADGSEPFIFDTLRLCSSVPPSLPQQGRLMELSFGGPPELEIVDTSLYHLGRQRYASLGVAELIADDGQLIVDNLGSSGQDGVRAYGRNPQTGKEIKIAARSAVFQSPPPEGGFPELVTSAHGLLNGNPGSQLGQSRVTLGSAGGIVPIGVDFSSLGAPEVRVMVCDGIDNDCDGAVELLIAPALQLGVDVCHLLAGAGDPPAVTGCGKLPGQPVPGGFQPPCFYWDFDRPFEFLPPGGEPGTGIVGCRLLLLAHGTPAPVDIEIVSMDLRSSDPVQQGPIFVLSPAGIDSFFDIWVELNFTPQEIEQLDAAGYCVDFDGDGLCEVEEFDRGLDPHANDSLGTGPSLTSSFRAGPAGETEEYLRITYQFDPLVEGTTRELRSSTDLLDFTADPMLWTLVEQRRLPGGNRQVTYEYGQPVSSSERVFVEVWTEAKPYAWP